MDNKRVVKIRFGDFEERTFSTTAPPNTVADNKPQVYNTEVRFENISPQVNVTKAKDTPVTASPIKGAVIEDRPIVVVANTEGATLHAMKKRCDYAPAAVDMAPFSRGHELLMGVIHEREEIRVSRALVDEYLATMDTGKAERMGKVLRGDDWLIDNAKHVFAKSEALVKEHGAQPRVVYQGEDAYNLIMGTVVFELSRRIREELSERNPRNQGTRIIYAVGLQGDEIGDIIHRTPGRVIENDFKNNDGSQPAAVRKMEAMFYYKLGAPKWFVREFSRTTSVRVWTRYGVAGEVKGQRWSGEVTTSTGNSYVNAAINLAALEKAGVASSTTLVYGDDQLTYLLDDPVPVKASLEEVSEATGMKSEVVLPEHREQATFLRKRFVPSVTTTHPVPSFGRVLAKLPVRANNNPKVNDDDYMAGKLLSAAYEHRHVPSLRDLLIDGSQQLSARPFVDTRNQAMSHGLSPAEMLDRSTTAKAVDSDLFHSFLRTVYGITEDELRQCYFESVSGILGFSVVNRGRPKHLAPLLPRALWGETYRRLLDIDAS